MTTPGRIPRKRLVATVSAVALLGAGALLATTAQAAPSLPPKTAEQLLVDVQSPTTDTLSGTVRTRADLGLPALPDTGSGAAADDLTGLLAGENTLRVWMDGHDRSRISVIGDNEETTVVRNGTDVWAYSSADASATHAIVDPSAYDHKDAAEPPAGAPATPQEAAERFLAAIDPTTDVTTSGTARVAGRDAYELVLTPAASERTLVRSVTMAVDAETNLVLDVTVLGSGSDPALQVGYSRIDYDTPDAELFSFSPPPGTAVEELAAGKHPQGSADTEKPAGPEGERPRVVGEGWDAVVVTPAGELPTDPEARQLLDALPRVSGDWGSGRLLSGTVFSAVLADDGRIAAGAVPPELLYDALR